jgi:hypothetical protein
MVQENALRNFQRQWGERKLTGDNLKVAWPEFSTRKFGRFG